MGIYRTKNPGKGCLSHGMKRIVVSFDDDTFEEVRALALKKGVSFGEVVRQLVEFGLLDVQEAV